MNIHRLGTWICAVVCISAMTSSAIGQVQFLDQHWDELTRQSYYTTTQGSRLMPYDWFLALEVDDGTASFLKGRVPQLGYIPNNNLNNNPDRLPVGFVADTDWRGTKFVGLNCAACHTNRIQFQGKTYQIDGGPALADMWGLLTGIGNSLNATASQPDKFARFARNVLGSNNTEDHTAELRSDLEEFRLYWNAFIVDSTTDSSWGRGRLDAIGMIFNRVSSIDLGLPLNSEKPNAPVSYPFLWGTSAEDKVQWNGSAPNSNDIERLGRNVGEVLGVFGAADLQKASIFRPYYRTSARRLNQLRLENWLKTLWSPSWPAEFGQIDEQKRQAGQALYAQHCIHCHQIVPHGQQNTPVEAKLIAIDDVGTDTTMALNAATRTAHTGRLTGSLIPGFPPLSENVPKGALLFNVVRGAILSPFVDVQTGLHDLRTINSDILAFNEQSLELSDEAVQTFLQESDIGDEDHFVKFLNAYQEKLNDYNHHLAEFAAARSNLAAHAALPKSDVLVYKARPLDGIWATAPYLHNGSVPNLYEMLLPANKRSKDFWVGNSEFDPIRVGFRTDNVAGATKFDTTLPGNSNSGHDSYGNSDFTEEQRLQLLEYLKSL